MMPGDTMEDESGESAQDETMDMEHIRAFVEGCDDDELEYLKQAIENRESDMESDTSEKPAKASKSEPTDKEYDMSKMEEEF